LDSSFRQRENEIIPSTSQLLGNICPVDTAMWLYDLLIDSYKNSPHKELSTDIPRKLSNARRIRTNYSCAAVVEFDLHQGRLGAGNCHTITIALHNHTGCQRSQ